MQTMNRPMHALIHRTADGSHTNHPIRSAWFWGTRLALALALVLIVLASGSAAPAAQAQDNREADVMVTMRAEPSILVARGDLLTYTVRVDNLGDGATAYTRVEIPFDATKVSILDARFTSDNDYVYEIEDGILTVHVGEIGKDSSRSFTILMLVGSNLPDWTIIEMWSSFDWEDQYGNYELNLNSNAAPVLVADVNVTSEFVWAVGDPTEGPAGTTFFFFSDRFVPDEDVEAWLEYPNGERNELSNRQNTDSNGRVHIHFESNGLQPGAYKMILIGEDSDLISVVDFTITP